MRIAPVLLLAAAGAAPLHAQDGAVHATVVHTAAGDRIENGHVSWSGGKITNVGKGGGGGEVLEAYAVTPGLVDLSVRITTSQYSVEQSTEAAADLSVAEGLDLFSHRWWRELRSGVTTALATPEDYDVIGGLGVVLKTGGAPTLDARLVRGDACLRASMGSQPSEGNFPPRGFPPVTFYARRPTTRMGVEWIFRKTYYDALADRANGVVPTDEHARRSEEILLSTLQGDLPVICQAWATQDIRTAVYLKEEFGIERMIVDAAAEAWKEPELLVRSGMGVILPPFSFEGRLSEENAFFAWNTAALLNELGVPLALSGHDSRDPGDRLARQPGYAMRGGLPFDAALAAVTITPARMVGVDDRVGSLEAGKDADLVLWSGPPFEVTSQILGVVLNGELVYDARAKAN